MNLTPKKKLTRFLKKTGFVLVVMMTDEG